MKVYGNDTAGIVGGGRGRGGGGDADGVRHQQREYAFFGGKHRSQSGRLAAQCAGAPIDPYAAITLGNGRFAFTADVTGLQTFNDVYQKDFPLCTMATWAWHTTPHGADIDPAKYRYKQYLSHGRMVSYDTDVKGQAPVANWMRENPHRMHLGRIGLVLKKADGTDATPGDVTGIDQVLDLWTGCAESHFMVWGEPVRVLTCVDPESDALAVRIESGLIRAQRLAVLIAFPYPTPGTDMADWKSPEKHESVCTIKKSRARLHGAPMRIAMRLG